MNSKSWIFYLLFIMYNLLLGVKYAYAEEITILYTAGTHAMLYPCSCPGEPDGGVARRAALIKKLKKEKPDTLVLDSGGFFAGGSIDQYAQNTELDKARTMVNLKAMMLMQYDAVAIGDDEFNFGWDFLQNNTGKTTLNFLSCNVSSRSSETPANLFYREWFKPYVIKELAGIKIGIIGVTPLSARKKAEGLKFLESRFAVKQAGEELKKIGTDIIILLGNLEESEYLELIKEIPEIDILIAGYNPRGKEFFTKIDSTLVLRPSWQGRRLGRLSLIIKGHRIAGYKAEELRLSDKISDDAQILSVLPRCFSDAHCKKEGFIGLCQNPGSLRSSCQFTEATKVSLKVILPKVCAACNTEDVVGPLKLRFPGLIVSYLYFPDSEVDKMIRDFGIESLPAYLLGKEAEKEKGFAGLRENLEMKGNFYIIKPQFSGISYFLNRKRIAGKLDLFISFYDRDSQLLLDVIKEFNPQVHFLAIQQEEEFDARNGNLEEYIRSVCVKKYYPQIFWDYISCRAKNINTSWWQDCLKGIDANNINTCARSPEGKMLLRENISLNKELKVMLGPVYLLENQEIFGTKGMPTKEELRKIIKGQGFPDRAEKIAN
jgi:hypothetical protein